VFFSHINQLIVASVVYFQGFFPDKSDAVAAVQVVELCGVIANYQYKLYNSALFRRTANDRVNFSAKEKGEKRKTIHLFFSIAFQR
jgi:hypothetical protein